MEVTALADHIKDQIKPDQGKAKGFPVDVFPFTVQEIIKELNSGLNYPIDYTASTMLCAASVSIGNTHVIKVKTGWFEGCPLWVALVGRPGGIKSHPLNAALKPIIDRDAYYYRQYKDAAKAHKTIADMTPQQRKDAGHESVPPEPKRTQFVVSDTTPEALAGIMEANPRGVVLHRDELSGWIKDFGRYSKGGDQENWLSIWSRSQISINRKNAGSCVITKPFVTVCGTMQTGILEELAEGGRGKNGFTDRILFAMPEVDVFSTLNDDEVDDSIFIEWRNIVERLLEMYQETDEYGNVQPIELSYTSDAKTIIAERDKKLTKIMEGTTDEILLGIYSKQKTYTHRFALILQMLMYATGEGDRSAVSVRAAEGAIKVSDYFTHTAIKAAQYITGANPVVHLPINKQTLYRLLPEEVFTTGQALEINRRLDDIHRMEDVTVKRFLADRKLFDKVRRGHYEKIAA